MNNAHYHLRLVAYLLLLLGFGLLLRNLLLTYDAFNPSYLGYYFKQEVLSPIICILCGIFTRLAEQPIARWLTKDN